MASQTAEPCQTLSIPCDLELVSWPATPLASPRQSSNVAERSILAKEDLLSEAAALIGMLAVENEHKERSTPSISSDRVMSTDLTVDDPYSEAVEDNLEDIIGLYESKSWLGIPPQCMAIDLAASDSLDENLEELYESKSWLTLEVAPCTYVSSVGL